MRGRRRVAYIPPGSLSALRGQAVRCRPQINKSRSFSNVMVRLLLRKFDEYQAGRCNEKERDGSQDGRAQPLGVEPRDVGLETHGGESDG